MKNITSAISLCFAVILSINLSGQITINQHLFPLKASFEDSLYSAQTSSVSAGTTGTNQTWDYSALQKLVLKTETYSDAKDSLAFNAVHFHRSDVNILSNPLISYSFLNVDAQGYYQTGRYTIGTTVDLSTITGSAGDELIIPNQQSFYNNVPYRVRFPTTTGTTWTFHTVQTLDYNITIDANNLNNTPGTVELHEINQTDVIGSGHIIIPNENNNALPPVEALLLKISANYIDSIFLNGTPAPAAQLSPFGLVQGAKDSIEYYTYYAPGSGQFIASYGLSAQGNIIFFNYRPSAARNASKFMSDSEFSLTDFKIYPMPFNAGDKLTIETESKIKTLKITNMQGKLIYRENMKSSLNHVSFSVPPSFSSGLYFIELFNDDDKVVNHKLIELVK